MGPAVQKPCPPPVQDDVDGSSFKDRRDDDGRAGIRSSSLAFRRITGAFTSSWSALPASLFMSIIPSFETKQRPAARHTSPWTSGRRRIHSADGAILCSKALLQADHCRSSERLRHRAGKDSMGLPPSRGLRPDALDQGRAVRQPPGPMDGSQAADHSLPFPAERICVQKIRERPAIRCTAQRHENRLSRVARRTWALKRGKLEARGSESPRATSENRQADHKPAWAGRPGFPKSQRFVDEATRPRVDLCPELFFFTHS